MKIQTLFERCFIKLGARLGFRVEKEYRALLRNKIPSGARLYVGCGDQSVEGYLGCDLRPLPNVTLACRAWEISQHCNDLSEIYSRHMLEHLTYDESMLALKDWHKALGPNGTVRIEVPNIRFAINQWLRSQWDAVTWENRYSDARWGFAGLFGWQRECNPVEGDYSHSYWDVHKSGYDEQVMKYFLETAGFQNVSIRLEGFTPAQMRRRKLPDGASDGCHLVAVALKNSGAVRIAA